MKTGAHPVHELEDRLRVDVESELLELLDEVHRVDVGPAHVVVNAPASNNGKSEKITPGIVAHNDTDGGTDTHIHTPAHTHTHTQRCGDNEETTDTNTH